MLAREHLAIHRLDLLGDGRPGEGCRARGLPRWRPWRRCDPALPSTSPRASASCEMSPGSTSRPVTPGSTSSGVPPTAVAITARPVTIASQITVGSPSLRDGSTNTSHAPIHVPTSSCGTLPANRTASPEPELAHPRLEGPRSGPSPTTASNGARRRAGRSAANASTRFAMPLRSVRCPTNRAIGRPPRATFAGVPLRDRSRRSGVGSAPLGMTRTPCRGRARSQTPWATAWLTAMIWSSSVMARPRCGARRGCGSGSPARPPIRGRSPRRGRPRRGPPTPPPIRPGRACGRGRDRRASHGRSGGHVRRSRAASCGRCSVRAWRRAGRTSAGCSTGTSSTRVQRGTDRCAA